MDPPADLIIRAEQLADHAAIFDVVAAAFGSAAEAKLVDAIRASPEFIAELSLVAERGSQVVGHVMISHALLVDGESRRQIAMLSPLAVHPDQHGHGIGSALVRTVTADADARGEPLVILEGSPVFYGRCGFEPAARRGINLPLPSWASPEAGQVLLLTGYDPSLAGNVVYPSAFDAVTEH